MTKYAWMRQRSPGLRRRSAVVRCIIAALLLAAIVFLHHTEIKREAALLVDWSTSMVEGAVQQASPQPAESTPPQQPSTQTSKSTSDASPGASNDDTNTPTGNTTDNNADKGKALQSTLSDTVMHLLKTFMPSGIDPPWPTDRFDSTAWHWGEPEPVNVTDLLQLDEYELQKMKRAHQGFLGAVSNRLPEYVPHRYGGGQEKEATTPRRGIVTVGGGKYFVILAVSLRFLRRAGTTLPVEVFVTEDEYEKTVCEQVLPKLDAVCRVYPQIKGSSKDGSSLKIQGFQLKAFALLFSTFDEVLFLDADNTAIRNIGPLFESAPFQQTGLVTWPDFWQTSVSPLYYEISSPVTLALEPPAPNQKSKSKLVMPITARPSTETGQLLIDKRRHWKTLLLAVYYNYYGPAFYYRLLNQGGTGMGDKETFMPAAATLGLPAYQVHTPVERVGHRFENNSTGSRVMIQYDAADDWAVTEAQVRAMTESDSAAAALPKNEDEWKAQYQGHVRPLFLHLSWPKWDPTILLGHISKWSDMTMGIDGKPEPAFHYPPEMAAQIRGTERMLWEEARWVACHLNGNKVRHWHNNQQAERACGRLNDHFARVLDTDVGRGMGLGPEDVLYPAMTDDDTS
ncbi:mannosyltransferase [Sporothrix curviconia]|uniref:Mannosyltransferase n=1 Tax=Sporothrix curviconia TaxID=1260050 RepID=A0ABP0B630_9PEZI